MAANSQTAPRAAQRFRHYLMIGITEIALLHGVPALAAPSDPSQQDSEVKNFHIAGQPLASALSAFAQQSGRQISYDPAITTGISTKGVSGTLTPEAALSTLLNGTSVQFRKLNARTLILERKSSSSITLGPVRVGGAVTHQDPTGPGVGYFAENTMAGTKTDTPLIEIPNSIYVVTKQQMVDQQAQNVAQALRYSAGVYSEAQGTNLTGAAYSGENGIRQRGFVTTQFVDGLQSSSYTAAETAFLDRIEVVNGPASVTYGQTAPGGLIGMDLKKPTTTPLRQATVGFGNWGRYEATVDVSDKITKSGNLRYRVAAIGVTQGTQTQYVDYKRVGVLPSLTWDIDHKTSLSILGSYIYTPDSGANTVVYPIVGSLLRGPYGRISRSVFLGMPRWNTNKTTSSMFEYQFRHKFNSFLDFQQVFRWEASDWDLQNSYFSEQVSASEVKRRAWEVQGYNRTVALDTRLTGRVTTGPLHHTWIVGSDFRQIESKTANMFGEFDTLNLFSPDYNFVPCIANPYACGSTGYLNHTSYFQEGVYFQDQIKWGGLSVILGGRQDWFNTTNRSGSRQYNSDGTSTLSGGSPSERPQSAFTWRAGLVYKFDFGLAPYFSYSTSFVPQTTSDWRGKPFSPLTGKQFEVGLKYQIPKTEVFLTAAAFHLNEDHYLVGDNEHPNFSADAGRVAAKGVELSANANITKDLHLTASYTYTDIRYAKNNLTTSKIDLATLSETELVAEQGKYVQNVPRNMMSVFIDYTLPRSIFHGLGVNWGIRYIGFTYPDAANSYKVPAYVLFDIGAHYDFSELSPKLHGLKAQLAISNLTNKYYVTGCSSDQCYLGQARRFYGNISYNW